MNLEVNHTMEKFENMHQDASLMRKVLLKEADEAELNELEKRFAECPDLREVYEQLQNGETLQAAWGEYQRHSSKKAYHSFLQHIGSSKRRERHRKVLQMRWYAAAAVVVMAIGLSFYMLSYDLPVQEREISRTVILPGTRQAQLALEDGNVIDVNKKEQVSVVMDGVRVEYKKGILSYQPAQNSSLSEKVEEEAVSSNELVIPRGGENTVVLADGTTVYLNAGSKLIYPVRFTGNRRMVTLEGEAYFDVTRDVNRPFVVHTHLGDVTVFGTAFNVNAYVDSPVCYTTLVHGKVSFTVPGRKSVTLLPGEQVVVSSESIEKQTVDVDEYVGWMKGTYTFNNRSLEEIMKTFERWYDIQIYFETPALRNIAYSGSLKRYGTINSFLDALELTGDLTYKINGRNILIYDKTRAQ